MAAFDDLEEGVGSGTNAHEKWQERTNLLRECFVGGSAPDDPVEGQLWLDTSGEQPKLKLYCKLDGGALSWVVTGPLERLGASPNGDSTIGQTRATLVQFKGLRVENRAELPTETADNAGMLAYLTPTGELYVADQPVSGGWKGLLSVTPASRDTVELALDGSLGNDAVNPPTAAAKGVLAGWLFDATNEKRTLVFVVPPNWSGDADVLVRLHQVLNQAETAGDDIEWTGEVRTLVAATEKVTKAATAIADSVLDIGAVADGIDDGGGPFVSELVLDHDDATNPISPGCLVLLTAWRKTVGGAGLVGGTIVFRADLAYTQTPRHERA